MRTFLAGLLVLFGCATYGIDITYPLSSSSGGGGGSGVSPSSGRVFYVATNGSDASGAIGNSATPFAPNFNTNGALYLQATNIGDVIAVLPGTYYVTNVFIRPGVTFQGVNFPVFSVSTNSGNFTSLFASFQPGSGAIIRGIQWEGTNTYVVGTSVASFMGGGPPFTNVLIDHCRLSGGFDVFFAVTNTLTSYLQIQNCYVDSLVDIIQSSSIKFVSIANTFVANVSGASLLKGDVTDTGSLFSGFQLGSLGQDIKFYGSTIRNSGGGFISPDARQAGWYLDTNRNFSVSLGPDGGTYLTNFITTNVLNTFGSNTLIVTASSQDATCNGTYTLKSFAATAVGDDMSTGVGIWTNAASTRTITLNDPVETNSFGITSDLWGIKTNSNSGYVYEDQQIMPTAAATGVASVTLQLPTPSAVVAMATNSISTNAVYTYAPALFGGAIVLRTNTLTCSNLVTIATSNTNTISCSAAPGITNSSPFNYIMEITGGTGMALKDGNGNGFATPILGGAIVFKPGWRLTGTTVTALGIAQ